MARLLSTTALVTASTAGFAQETQISATTADVTRSNISVVAGTDQSYQHAALLAGNGYSLLIDGGTVDVSPAANQQRFGANVVGGSLIDASNITITMTDGSGSHAVQAHGPGSRAVISDSRITTTGTYSTGLHATYDSGQPAGTQGGQITATNVAIETSGNLAHGVHSESGSSVALTGGSITTGGIGASGIVANNDQGGIGGTVTAEGTQIVTTGAGAAGVSALAGGSVTLVGGSVSTSGGAAQIDLGQGPTTVRAYGLAAHGAGSIITSSANVATTSDWTFGAFANEGGTILLTGGTIITEGSRAFGVLASNGGSVTSAATIITSGASAHGIQAGAESPRGNETAGTVQLAGGSITTSGDGAYGLHAIDGGSISGGAAITTSGDNGFGAFAEANSRIDLAGATIVTTGDRGFGIIANNDTGDSSVPGGSVSTNNVSVATSGTEAYGLYADQGGSLSIANTSVSTTGANADALYIKGASAVVNGSTLSASGTGSSAVHVEQGGTVTLTGTTLVAAQAPSISVVLGSDLQYYRAPAPTVQDTTITLGSGTVATVNNGTLLDVSRTGSDGQSGVVNFTLGAGSVSSGNIVDLDEKSNGGGTTVTLETGANWTGQMLGVAGFTGQQGGTASFGAGSRIEGDVAGNGTSFVFHSSGAEITGNVSLSSGSVSTGGSIGSPVIVGGDVGVDGSSIMGGNWRIAGDLESAGTITPGNSIGRVEVAGNLTLQQSGVYAVEVDGNGNADLIAVGGTANLAGNVSVSSLGGVVLNQPYTILTAGVINGSFADVSFAENYAFLSPTLSYGDTSVLLSIERNALRYAAFATTANQIAVADALESLPVSSGLGSAIVFSTADTVAGAFDQLSGEVHASVKTGLSEESRHVRDTAMERIRAAFAAPSTAGSSSGPWESAAPVSGSEPTAWAQVFGAWGHTSGTSNAGRLDRDTGGVLLGVDGFVHDAVRLGILAGYSHSSYHVDDRNSAADSDNFHLGIYAGTQVHGFGIRGGFAYSWHDVETSRVVAFPGFADALSASYDAGTAQVFGEVGYAIALQNATIEPFAGLTYVNVDVDGFNEIGGAAALSGGDSRLETTYSTLGLRASTAFAISTNLVRANGMIGWRHAFDDRTPASTFALAGGAPFTVIGVPVAEDAAVLELGLETDLSEDATLGVSYNGQFSDGASEHGAQAKLSYRF